MKNSTHTWRSLSHFGGGALLLLAIACSAPMTGDSACGAVTVDTTWADGRTYGEQADTIAAVRSRQGVSPRGTMLYARELDVNCDGRLELITQVNDSGQLYLDVFMRDTTTRWLRVLRAPSRVTGREIVVELGVAGSFNVRSFATVGSDEGGIVPRVFNWNGSSFASLGVPVEYALRMEELWTPECRRRNAPRALPDGRFVLSRETISRSSNLGHGAECALPRDTLRVLGNSLRP